MGDVVEDDLEVELLRQAHDGLDVVALVDADDDRAFAVEVGNQRFELEVALEGLVVFLWRPLRCFAT